MVRPNYNSVQDKLDTLIEAYLLKQPSFAAVARSNDPALAGKSDEDILAELAFYPGIVAAAAHEEARRLYEQAVALEADTGNRAGKIEAGKLKTQARELSEAAHSRSGIDIHPGTTIGDNLFIDHGTGVVIGETAKLGKNTLIYHGVTLGAYGKQEPAHRHPEIGNDCTISVDVNVLGNVKLGDRVVIGPKALLYGNKLVVESRVTISPGAQIGDGNTIKKGVRIGAGAVIPRGVGIIDQDVPAYQVASRAQNGELEFSGLHTLETTLGSGSFSAQHGNSREEGYTFHI